MIGLILTIALCGFICWLIVTYIPMPEPFGKIIIVVVAVLLLLYLIQIFGIGDIPIPRFRS